MKFNLFAFALIASLFSTAASAAQTADFTLKASKDCELQLEGATSIPRLYCVYSLGLKASEIAKSDLKVIYDMDAIPYSDYEARYDLGPEIVIVNGYYAFAFTYLDDMLDGFTTAEGAQFRDAVIATLEADKVVVTLQINSDKAQLDRAQLGRLIKQ
jgi:hypothetical protein